jgi:hypothetical protein
MMRRRPRFLLVASLASFSIAAAGCSAAEDEEAESFDHEFSSREAILLDFEADGELLTDSTFNTKAKIQDQFLYTIGQLNGERSVGRLDKLVLTDVVTHPQGDGTFRVTYHAKMPVAWGKRTSIPSSYTFTLPRVVSYAGLQSFTSKYKDRCVDWSARDVDSGSMWYYYRPAVSGCALDPNDVLSFTAAVSHSTENTTGKYPEYHRVWEDDELRVVAIFGKNEDGATANDAGISAYNSFIRSMRGALGPLSLQTEPASVPNDPGIAVPDVTFKASLADGKKVFVTALLVDNVRTAGAGFDARYNALSTDADLIMYNGHAGLGQNVRALANKGKFVAGKYLLLFMNGCDTFAYVDGSLAQKRAALNPDDNADGTKYMDIVTNAMPSYFHQNSNVSTAFIKGLLSIEQPKTFEQIFEGIDRQQVVLVTGEEDNVFTPGMPIGSGNGGGGAGYELDADGAVSRGQEAAYETPELPAGTYSVTLDHDSLRPGGDADLYVRVGAAPSLSSYDCRPYLNGSKEDCIVTLSAPSKIHVKVIGYANAESAYKLAIRALGAPSGWPGLDESGSVARNEEKHYETPELSAGVYTFTLAGTGDADLYVKKGSAPTTASWDCRPYRSGSAETCALTLDAPSAIHVMVRGWAAQSTFTLTGR